MKRSIVFFLIIIGAVLLLGVILLNEYSTQPKTTDTLSSPDVPMQQPNAQKQPILARIDEQYTLYTEGREPCIDPDGGDNPFVQGEVPNLKESTAGADTPRSEWKQRWMYSIDYCVDQPQYGIAVYEGSFLKEYFCLPDHPVAGAFNVETYRCPYGCQDGACLDNGPLKPEKLKIKGAPVLSP